MGKAAASLEGAEDASSQEQHWAHTFFSSKSHWPAQPLPSSSLTAEFPARRAGPKVLSVPLETTEELLTVRPAHLLTGADHSGCHIFVSSVSSLMRLSSHVWKPHLVHKQYAIRIPWMYRSIVNKCKLFPLLLRPITPSLCSHHYPILMDYMQKLQIWYQRTTACNKYSWCNYKHPDEKAIFKGLL